LSEKRKLKFFDKINEKMNSSNNCYRPSVKSTDLADGR